MKVHIRMTKWLYALISVLVVVVLVNIVVVIYKTPGETTSLIVAVTDGDRKAVERIIDGGADVNALMDGSWTPLTKASFHGHKHIAELLIERGAELNLMTSDGMTPLMVAALYGHGGIVGLLIENGADPNTATPTGATALMLAAGEGYSSIVVLLVESGADLDAVTGTGATPLMLAAMKGYYDTARTMVEGGADVNRRDVQGSTPLIIAARSGELEIARLLIENGADLDAKDRDGKTAIMVARDERLVNYLRGVMTARRGEPEKKREKAGKAEVVVVDERRASSGGDKAKGRVVRGVEWYNGKLFVAVAYGDLVAVRGLIRGGAKVNARNGAGETPLMVASEMGRRSVVSYLLARGAKVNRSKKSGATALMGAAYKGHDGVLRLLIEKGADPNRADENGTTALMKAVRQEHAVTVRLLLASGADVNARDDEDWTALTYAMKMSTPGIVRIVEEAIGDSRRAKAASHSKGKRTSRSVKASVSSPSSDVDTDIPVTGIVNTDAVAVVIGNRDYTGDGVPSVDYALNDAKAVKEYLVKVLGYREGNIIYMPNATKADFEVVFGNRDSFDGKLYNWARKGRSDIFVYYSGHGAPDVKTKQAYFVPVDADPDAIRFSGYPLSLLYGNLEKIAEAKAVPNVFVVIDSCFSGRTEKGSLLKNVSPLAVEVETQLMKLPGAVVMTSASGDEVSSWYPEMGHSMFTYFMLKGLKESVERGGPVTVDDIFKVISDRGEGVPYYARRLNGRVQTPQLTGDRSRVIIKR